MRISVCEFLRLMTHTNWFYVRPGIWASDRWTTEARRDEHQPDHIHLYRNGRRTRTLEYFEGESSTVVRIQNRQA